MCVRELCTCVGMSLSMLERVHLFVLMYEAYLCDCVSVRAVSLRESVCVCVCVHVCDTAKVDMREKVSVETMATLSILRRYWLSKSEFHLDGWNSPS